MANGTIHKLGTLYIGSSKKKRPKYPIGGDIIPTLPDGTMIKSDIWKYSSGDIEIKDTDENEEYQLQWIEVNDNGKRLLVCDRCILISISWNELNEKNLIDGKIITIDNNKYKIRLLSGGNEPKKETNSPFDENCGLPEDNEWDRIIVNRGNFEGLPNNADEEIHNKLWNWEDILTITKEKLKKDENKCALRGQGGKATYFNDSEIDNKWQGQGWRPVLEEINEKPIISGEDENLGVLFFNFEKEYSISNETKEEMKVVEKINGNIIRTLEKQPSGTNLTLDISDFWNDLDSKEHNIEIEVTTTSGNSSVRTVAFKKAKATKKKLGTLYIDGKRLSIPEQPYETGDLFKYGEGLITIEEKNEPDNYKLQWVEVNYNGKGLLICDRVMMSNVAWAQLMNQGLIDGKEIQIDGKKYILRVIDGGNSKRGDSFHDGALPTDNEWDKIIVNEGNFENLPIPTSSDLDGKLDDLDKNGEHNQTWNWYKMFSLGKSLENGTNDAAIRGYNSSKYYNKQFKNDKILSIGYRPVLEKINTAPTISDSDGDIGEFNTPVKKTYTVNDIDGDKLTIVEKVDDKVVRILEEQDSPSELTLDLSEKWNEVDTGVHTITIEANDTYGVISFRRWTFTKTNSTPIEPKIIYPTPEMRISKNSYVIFKVGEDLDGDTQSVSLQLSESEEFDSSIIEVSDNIQKNIDGEWVNHIGEISSEDIEYEFRIPINVEEYKDIFIRIKSTDSKSIVYSEIQKNTIGNRIEFETLPQKIDFIPYSISLTDKKEIDSKAIMEVYACNNALDKNKQWENITEEYKSDKPYVFTNKNKENENWAISVKYKIEANDATGEISIDAIGIGVV